MIKETKRCRICGNSKLVPIIDLGMQNLTGVFPRSIDEIITQGPLELVRCKVDGEDTCCGLVQLRHSYDCNEMYGSNYGYRSGLNNSMVSHLKDVVGKSLVFISLRSEDLVIDIGSNDGTLLGFYPKCGAILMGIDPTAQKFRKYYSDDVKILAEFFSAQAIRHLYGNKRARIITSIAMFYDLEDPMTFVNQISEILDEEGIWVLEQSYLPLMLQRNAYDTICHEHLEYYCLKQIKWLLDRTGLKIIDIEFNDINGGSFKLTVAKAGSHLSECTRDVRDVLDREKGMGLDTAKPYSAFGNKVEDHRKQLQALLINLKRQGKKVVGYGASTKGNVILQYCGITRELLPCIAEVNQDKFGAFTPGTWIPIISEQEARAIHPDYFLVFPWHFRDNFLERERAYLKKGGRLIIPLPEIEIIGN